MIVNIYNVYQTLVCFGSPAEIIKEITKLLPKQRNC